MATVLALVGLTEEHFPLKSDSEVFELNQKTDMNLTNAALSRSINLRHESLITVDYKYEGILLFAFLDVKLWRK